MSSKDKTTMNGKQNPSISCEKENGIVGKDCEPESLTISMKQRIRTFAPMCTSYFCFYAGSCFLFIFLIIWMEFLI